MSSESEIWTLCVDFGTAYSKAAAAPHGAWAHFEPGLVRPLMLADAEAGGNAFLLDSAVFVDDDRILFGRAAVERAEALAHKKRTALRSFKTLLSVSDLERGLNTSAPASIDPHRLFPMRDLIVLYLAFLTASIARAIEADPVLAGIEAFERRYAAPAWRSGDSAGLHGGVLRLFGEAEALSEIIGPDLLAGEGVAVGSAPGALAAARAAPSHCDMGLIFEATAAASYTSIGLEESASHLIVIDVGAGTTDIAALARRGRRIEELPEARVTLKQGGDHIDRIIANLALAASPWAKTQEQQTELWNALMVNMADIKDSLFFDGRAVLRNEGRAIALSLRDLERDPAFRAFAKVLVEAFDHALEVVRDAALMADRREIQAIAVGGGASAPFVQELIRRKPTRAGKLTFVARPATPDWAHGGEFEGNLAPVFPQLAIAVGGALAPETMLAAPGGITLVGGGRSDTLAVRD